MCDRCEAMARDLERARRQIQRQQQLLRLVRQVAGHWQAQADQVLSQPSGVKRGVWAYSRGVSAAARAVLAAFSQFD